MSEKVEKYDVREYFSVRPKLRTEARFLLERKIESPYVRMTYEQWDALMDSLLHKKSGGRR